MKATLKRALSVLCALALCIGLLPVSALAADENTQNEYVQFDYGSPITGSGWTYTVRLLKPDGDELTSLTVHDFARGNSHTNTLTLLGDTAQNYQIASIEQSPGIISWQQISETSTSISYQSTYTGDSATLTVQLAPFFNEDDVKIEGEEITDWYHNFYYNMHLDYASGFGAYASPQVSTR